MSWNRNRKLVPRPAFIMCLLWPALFVLSQGAAEALQRQHVSMNAGETYVIKDLDPDFTALVNFFDNARPFIVQSSAAGSLVVLGVEKGNGRITVARHGERVRYDITVNAIFDAHHPLAPGVTPPWISDDDIIGESSASRSATVLSDEKSEAGSPYLASKKKPSAREAVPVSGPPSIVRDFKISAEPGDEKLDPGATPGAVPSADARSTGKTAPGFVAASADSGSGSENRHSARAGDVTNEGTTPTGASSRSAPATAHVRVASSEDGGRDASARTDAANISAHVVTPPTSIPSNRHFTANSTASGSGYEHGPTSKPPELVASLPPPTTPSSAALRSGVESPTANDSSPESPIHASAVGVVPSQSVNLPPPPPAPRERYTSNPPVPDEGANGESDSVGARPLPAETILLTRGMSRVYEFPARIRRVSIADTDVADIQVVNPHQVMLLGRQPGMTTLEVWDREGNVEERQIVIDKRGAQQVMLNVVVAEINRGRLENQGLNYSVALAKMGLSLVSLPGLVATPYSVGSNLTTVGSGGSSSGGILPPGGNLIPLILSPNLTYGLAAQNSNAITQTFFQFLEDHNLGRVLARPRLLANSGEQARFLSGGEIPIVVSQALNTSIVFKQFGTSVVFVPVVIGRHALQLTVRSEVSSPDFSQGIVENGFSVPGFVTRRAETALRMSENQTLIIAGLVLEQTTSNVNKVPFLGDIPFIGYAFRTSSYNHSHTELIMTVTPEIVEAIPVNGEAVLPTERPPLSPQDVQTGPVSPPDVTRPRPW